ncbi:hypothetical protein CAMGR0001_1821, partial [Campylobacter gracilis RM3268]
MHRLPSSARGGHRLQRRLHASRFLPRRAVKKLLKFNALAFCNLVK